MNASKKGERQVIGSSCFVEGLFSVSEFGVIVNGGVMADRRILDEISESRLPCSYEFAMTVC